MERTADRADLRSIQGLRAVAALMVVVFHAASHYDTRSAHPASFQWWTNGSAGVDVFFVISGIVIILSARRLQAAADGWRRFLVARLRRIVPMYWLVTAVKIAIIIAAPAIISRAAPLGAWHTIGSFLFIPVPDASGSDLPVVEIGWTLTYEMMFYGLIALALFCRIGMLRVVACALGLFAVCRFLTPEFGNTIVVEFLFGVLIATFIGRLRLPVPASAALLVGGFVLVCIMPIGSGVWRPLTWGLPAAALVLGAVTLERPAARFLPAWLLLLGDASYSLYLSHGFVIPVVYGVGKHLHFAGQRLMLVTLAGGIVGSAVFAVCLFLAVERPMLRWMRGAGARRSRRPAFASGRVL